jgi:ketosteroid isomerase-like protein
MQQLHDDTFLYGIFGNFLDGEELLEELRKENFWGVSYTLQMVEPRVRMLSSDTALVLFQLVGRSVGPTGERPYSSLFTLVYQKRSGDWKIVHVHDSESAESGS